MKFGIAQAMKAQEEVERTVVVPRDIVHMQAPSDYRKNPARYNVRASAATVSLRRNAPLAVAEWRISFER